MPAKLFPTLLLFLPICHAEVTSFEGDIAPILSRTCNNSALKGQNGFRLSVFGSDAAADYKAIVKENDGRRIPEGPGEESHAAEADLPGEARRPSFSLTMAL